MPLSTEMNFNSILKELQISEYIYYYVKLCNYSEINNFFKDKKSVSGS